MDIETGACELHFAGKMVTGRAAGNPWHFTFLPTVQLVLVKFYPGKCSDWKGYTLSFHIPGGWERLPGELEGLLADTA
jgi:hypothetical protein